MDTKELTEAVDGALDIFEAVRSAKADGTVNLLDIPKFLGVIPALFRGINGAEVIPAELKDLTPEEAKVLVDHVMSRLSIDSAHAQQVAAASLNFASAAYGLVMAIKPPATEPDLETAGKEGVPV